MPTIDIVYVSTYGQTRKIAEKIADVLRQQGHDVRLDAASVPPRKEAESIVIGVPIYVGKPMPELGAWCKAQADNLRDKTVAFFMVSMNAADTRESAKLEDRRLLTESIEETGLHPRFAASFAGCVKYTEYGFMKRFLMKRICRTNGGPTDTSRDHELTDWSQVEAFAKAVGSHDGTSPFAAPDTSPESVMA